MLGWLEREAAFTRLGDGGIAQVDTHGLIAAAFDHRDSRLGDPDLHTHVAISNKVRAVVDHPDGTPRWVALDGRGLFHAGVAASDLVKGFSRRREVIEDRYAHLSSTYRRNHGRGPDTKAALALAQQATLDTRTAKQPVTAFADQLSTAAALRPAGHLGAAQLFRVVAHAQQRGAVVRLVGDPAQLSAVESGGALRLLAAETDPIELTCLHRFADPAEADATLGLRRGNPEAITFYEQHDRVRSGGTEAMVDAAFAGWRADTLAGQVSVMGAADTATVVGLSARARVDRIARGDVHPDGVALHDGNRAGIGDWVITRANDRHATVFSGRDFVRNGDLSTVTRRHRGDEPRSPSVLASRARQQTTLYVGTDEPCDPAADPVPAPARTGRDVLEVVMAHQAAEKSATETIRETLGQPHRLPTLVATYEHTLSVAPAAAIDTHRQLLLDTRRWRPLPWISIAGRTSTPGDDPADTGRTGQVGDLDVWVAALNDRAAAITTRVDRLTDRLAATPGDTSRAQVLAAAYREQFHLHTRAGAAP